MAYAPHSTAAAKPQSRQQASKVATPTPTSEPAFCDKRESSTLMLKLQTMMANSPQQQNLNTCAQLMANSSVQRRLNTTAQAIANRAEPESRIEEDEPLQAKFASAAVQLKGAADAVSPNAHGLPDNLRSGIESLSGISMQHVKVHYNSDKPAQLHAHAYAQGSEIHVAPGQERHLPHEAWHVVQQAQGRVQPTVQMKENIPVNDDAGLEAEADLMGAKALQLQAWAKASPLRGSSGQQAIVQRAAAEPDAGNAATYDQAKIAGTAGVGASTSVEVKTTIANKNPKSEPVAPVNAQYMLQNYGASFKSALLTTTVTDTGAASGRTYVPTKWDAYFNWDINKGHSLTQTHIIHHALAADANNNGNNIAWANAYLNNSTWWPALLGPQPRSVADREHEDRDTLNLVPFGRGGNKLASHLYNSAYKIRPYNGAWYTENNTMGLDTVKVPASAFAQVATNTFPSAGTIYQLRGGRYCMWYRSVPVYNTGKNYANNIRANIQAAYNARVAPQHTGEELDGAAWFDNVGAEIANSYASGFKIDSQFYELALKHPGFYPLKTDQDLPNMVYWTKHPLRSETINDPSPHSGGMQVQLTYAVAVKPTDADKTEKGVLKIAPW